MKTCRKSVAMVLPLLIHLLTLRIGDAVAGRNDTYVSHIRSDPKIILEEVVITGTGNDTRVTANALAEDASWIGGEIISLLSNGEIRGGRRLRQTSSSPEDQETAQSRTAIADDEYDLERLKRVVARYEPQRLTSRKTKRKIVDVPNGVHDVYGKAATSTAENLERAYAEVLQNISRKVPELLTANDGTLNPYLSQAMKNLRQIYIPNATIRPATNGEAQKSRSDVDSSHTSPVVKSKKTKKSFKKYLPLNRTITIPRVSSVGESRVDEETANGKESSTSGRYFKVPGEKTKPKNGSLAESSSNIYSDPAEKPDSRREWNVQDSSAQIVSPSASRSNNSNNYDLNVPNDNTVRLLSKYNVVPRPFSVSQSPNSPVVTSLEISHGNPSVSPIGFSHQQIARPSANVPPLVLTTDLFNPPSARRYIPIKRANRLEGNSATIVGAEASSPPTSPAGVGSTLAGYGALYADVIGTTRNPPVAVNGQRSSGTSDYYAITENPVERTDTATIYAPGQTSSASYALQRRKQPQIVRKNELLPGVANTYVNSPADEKSDLNDNPGIALYNKFASLYSTNVPNIYNVPKPIAQDYRDFKGSVQPSAAITSQQVSALPYASLKPTPPALPKVRPIAAAQPALAPYFDGKLIVSQVVDGKTNDDKNDKENVETNERSRVKDANESEEEAADDKSDLGNYKTQVNPAAYKIYKTSNEEREEENRDEEEKEDRYPQQSRNYGHHDKKNENGENEDRREKYENDEDERYPQQKRNYGHQDKHDEYDKNDKDNKNDDRREKYEKVRYDDNEDEPYPQQRRNYGYQNRHHEKNENDKNDDGRNVQHEDNEDEEDVDETQDDEHVNTEKNKNEDDHDRRHQYNKYEYNKNDSEEEQRDKQHYDRKKYGIPKGYFNTRDYETDFKQRFESNDKHSVPQYDDDETRERDKEYRNYYEQEKSAGDNRYKKNRQDRERGVSEDERIAEDKPVAQSSKDQHIHRQREKYEKEQDENNDTIYKHNHRHQANPRYEEHKREEYSETNPKHVREEYRHQPVEDNHRDHRKQDQEDEEVRDHVHGETQEHAHKHEEHHEKKKDGGNHNFHEGGGEEHEEGHHGHEGEKGDKGYKIWHENEKAEKGHHDKEHASKEYDEKGGEEKKHEEEGGYHKEHHHGEAGKKEAEFGEKGEHKKGHSTHGEHSVHKKDEYEKNTEFYDEFNEDGGSEKHGAHHHEHESKKGGHEKKGHHDGADHEEKYGKEKKHEDGGHHHEHKGHKVEEGHDHHYDHNHKHGEKEGHEHGKKWSYKKGDDGGGHKHKR